MNCALKNMLDNKRELLASSQIVVSLTEKTKHGSYSANLDSYKYVGTITYWPKCLYEFQFNSCESGDVIVLETKEFDSEEELSVFFEQLLKTKLAL